MRACQGPVAADCLRYGHAHADPGVEVPVVVGIATPEAQKYSDLEEDHLVRLVVGVEEGFGFRVKVPPCLLATVEAR